LLLISLTPEADMTTKKAKKDTKLNSTIKEKEVKARVLTEQELEMVTGGSGGFCDPYLC
jgi:hypothetical protein